MRNVILFCFLFFVVGSIQGIEKEKLFFVNINEKLGLPLTYSTCINQDDEGFIWFDYEGLSRFDGENILSFSVALDDSTSIISNVLNSLTPTVEGNIWVGTQNGLSYFDASTYKFRNYVSKFPKTIGTQFTNDVCIMDYKHIFIGSSTNGAFILNSENDSLFQFAHDENNKRSISSNCVYKILKNKNGQFWLATSSGLDLFNPTDQSFRHFYSGRDVRDVVMDDFGQLWVSFYMEPDLLVLDAVSGEFHQTIALPLSFKEKQKRLFIDSSHTLWIAGLDHGVYTYDFTETKTLKEVVDATSEQIISSPLKIFEDNFHNIWITTFNKGVFLFDGRNNPFPLVKINFPIHQNKYSGVRTLFEDQDGDVWVGAREGAVLSKYNRKTNESEYISLPLAEGVNLENDIIFSIEDAEPGNLWLATLHSGLLHFNQKRNAFRPIRYSSKYPNRLKSNSIYTLLNDGEGNLWIGYSDSGLDIYNIKNDSFEHYHANDISKRISNNKIRCIYKDKQGIIWVGTTEGLNKFDSVSRTFQSYYSIPYDTTSLIHNHVNCVYEDSRNILWVGTYLGLNRFDRNTGKVERFSKLSGYAFNNLFNVLEDDAGMLWLNGERGLSKFNVSTRSFDNYTNDNGLHNPVFFHTVYKLKNGELLFGGMNGFNVFRGEDVKLPSQMLDTKITDFKLFNRSVLLGDNSPLQKHILKTDSITLTYKHSVIGFDYSAINFGSSGNTVYAYRMDGFEKEWNYVDKRRSATYTSLPSGKYIFEVKASNSDGNWNSPPRRLYIKVLPPPWLTWWAYSLYVLIIVVSFLKYRTVLEKRNEQKRKEELDEEKMKFFMNISHEFRTPLTLMVNPLRDIQSDGSVPETIKGRISEVYRSAQKLLQLVTQLQEFRQLDFSGVRLSVQNVEVISLTKNLLEQFQGFTEKNNIRITVETTVEQMQGYLDVDKYEKILNNLLSNAFKYTSENGEITVQIGTEEIRSTQNITSKSKLVKHLVVEVQDTGIGMSKQHLDTIFERFFQVNSNSVGAGIGLNYVHSLVKIHRGLLDVKSKESVGTSFFVKLPMEQNQYTEEELSVVVGERENISSRHSIIDALEYDLMSMNKEEKGLSQEQQSGKKQSILIVEDNKALQEQLLSYLSTTYHVYTAKNGEEGIRKAAKIIPDLVISDIMMPVMDGIEMLKQLKKQEDTCHIPIILLTAKSLVEDQIKGYETGADAYIPKPFYMDLLMVRVENILVNRAILKERFNKRQFKLTDESITDIKSKDELFLDKAADIVMKHIDEVEFSVKNVYKEMGVSSTHFYNKISQLTGYSPSHFIRNIRLKYGAELLQKGKISIKEVSYSVGFSSPPYFAKCFKEVFSISPTEYQRKKHNYTDE